MNVETNTYLRSDIRNNLIALGMASTAMHGEYQQGYQDALRAVALSFGVRLDDAHSINGACVPSNAALNG